MPLDNISELKRRVPGGKYVLTRAVARRAQQLQEGSPPLTPVRVANPLSVAIDEIVQGKISFQMKDEAPDAEPDVEASAVLSTDDILRVDTAEDDAANVEAAPADSATPA